MGRLVLLLYEGVVILHFIRVKNCAMSVLLSMVNQILLEDFVVVVGSWTQQSKRDA